MCINIYKFGAIDIHRWGRHYWRGGNQYWETDLPETIITLLGRQHPSLSILSLDLERRLRQPSPDIPLSLLSPFHNLRILQLFNIHGDLKIRATSIAHVLAQNPQINELAFSLTLNAIDETDFNPVVINFFMRTLCSVFHETLNSPPLALHKLHLGYMLEATTTDLGKLCQSETLQQVYQYVGRFGVAYMKVDFEVFSYTQFPNLLDITWPVMSHGSFLERVEETRDIERHRSWNLMLDSWPKIEVDGKYVTQ